MKFSEGQQYENPPAGNFIARCYGVIDLGTQQHSWQGETWGSRDVRFSFELPTELMTGKYNPEVKGKPFSVHLTVKQSLHPKSKLRPLLEGWRGRKFTKEEAALFDAKKLVGMPCRLSLIQNGEYVNINGIFALGKNEKCPKQVNPSVFFSLSDGEFDQKVYASLHEKTREKIAKSPEFVAITEGEGGGSQMPDDSGVDDAGFDAAQSDDIPF